MLDVVFISLFQAATGDPASAPLQADQTTEAVTEAGAVAPAAEGPAPAGDAAPETVAPPVETAAPEAAAARYQVVCHNVRETGSRIRSQRVCTSQASSNEVGDAVRQIQTSGGHTQSMDPGN